MAEQINAKSVNNATPKPSKDIEAMDINALKGLSKDDAAQKLKQFGYNEISEKEETWFHRLFMKFWGPIPWMIEVAVILSAIARRWEDFAVILAMLLINAFVDFFQESKALSAISVLKKKLARKALVLRDGEWQSIDAREIVPEDIIKVKIGDVVPADCKLLGGGDFLQVDQAALTGESLPVSKQAGDDLYANAIIKQGEMIARVTATALNTYFGKTVALVAKAQKEEHGIIIYHGVVKHEPILDLLIFALILTIAAIPVAMPAVLTVTMALGARVLAGKEAIVTKLSAIEEAAGMDILCSDKTGTLTQNKMSLAKPYLAKGYTADVLMLYAAYASKKENQDPIETPIFDYLDKHNLNDKFSQAKMEKYIPFDPVHKKTKGIFADGMAYAKGAPQVIIEECDSKEFDKKAAYKQVESFAQKGFRALGVGFKKEEDDEYHFVGLIPLFDPPREDSKEAIAEANAKNVAVKMVTGDNISVARYISGILNIGDDIENIQQLKGESTKEYLYLSEVISRAIVKTTQADIDEDQLNKEVHDIVANVQKELDSKPLDKLQKANHIVGMTGDGVNDAPALKKADCGIAVSGATDAARAAIAGAFK